MSQEMNGKICLVTGATSGIGFATALGLAQQGAVIVIVGRDKEKSELRRAEILKATGNSRVEVMLCDLASQPQIRALAAEFLNRHGRLHVLVNNAASVLTKRTLTEDGLETQFAVNHLAYFLLTNLLLEALKTGAPSRVVNVASGMHKQAGLDFDNLQGEKSYKAMTHYGVMKLCNILFTNELARRLAGTGVTANSLTPGFTATGIARDFSPFSRFVFEFFGRPKEKGAETAVYLASSPDVEGVTGKYFSNKKDVATSRLADDRDAARRLWELSAKFTGLV